MEDILHPEFNKLYLTRRKEDKTTWVGTILLYEMTTQYKAFQWYLCLISPLDNTQWYKHKWGSDNDNKLIKERFTKPELFESRNMDIHEWYRRWRQLELERSINKPIL